MVRILFTIQYYDRPDGRTAGGMQTSTRLLARRLARRGHEVSVFCGMVPGGLAWSGALAARRLRRRPMLFERVEGGIRVITTPVPDEAVSEVVASFAPDVVLASGAGDLNRRVLTMTGAPPAVYYVRSAKAIETLADPAVQPRLVLAVSHFLIDEIANVGHHADFVPPLFEAPEPRLRSGAERDALFVNPVAAKGLDVALGLAARRPDVAFRFARAWSLSRAQERDLRHRTKPWRTYALSAPCR